jgi:hypothetical protein
MLHSSESRLTSLLAELLNLTLKDIEEDVQSPLT